MSGSTSAVRVLIVDDNDAFREAAIAVVEATDGFAVVGEAASGEHAVELAAAIAPQLVLLDVRMPTMCGLETARRISDADADVVILLLSANQSTLADLGGGRRWPIVDKADLAPEVVRTRWESAGRLSTAVSAAPNG